MNRTILFVDDEQSTLNALTRVFQGTGYTLLTAQGGEEALKVLEEHPVQVIISDQHMPGMSGVELLARVMERNPEIVRMLMTGHADVAEIAAAVNQDHVYKFLQKPWESRALLRDVCEAFEFFEHEQKSDRLSRLFESSAEGIVITDPDGVIQAVNPAFSSITGYAPEEAIGKKPSILKSGRHGDEFYRDMWTALKENGKWRGEIWNKRKSGEIILEWLTIVCVRDPQGSITQYTGMFSDITEYKRRQEGEHYQEAYQEAIADVFSATREDEHPHNWTELAEER